MTTKKSLHRHPRVSLSAAPDKWRICTWFLGILILSHFASCQRERSRETVQLEATIDSLNKIYSKPSENLADDLVSIGKVLNLSDSLKYMKGFAEASINIYRINMQNITIPATAKPGQIVMRVMNWSTNYVPQISPCTQYF